MRIPLTVYGLPEVVILPAVIFLIMIVFLAGGLFFLPGLVIFLSELILAAILLWVLSFFRDPYRLCPRDSGLFLSPADGRVTDIETVAQDDFLGSSATRIGIFLSIFDVHINRAPCNVRVEKVTSRRGAHRDARSPCAGRLNAFSELSLVRIDYPQDRVLVRQVSGAIARRIVCCAEQGQVLSAGEKFGMIKFGSRTELLLPLRDDIKCLVKTGDRVKAGQTVLARYERQK